MSCQVVRRPASGRHGTNRTRTTSRRHGCCCPGPRRGPRGSGRERAVMSCTRRRRSWCGRRGARYDRRGGRVDRVRAGRGRREREDGVSAGERRPAPVALHVPPRWSSCRPGSGRVEHRRTRAAEHEGPTNGVRSPPSRGATSSQFSPLSSERSMERYWYSAYILSSFVGWIAVQQPSPPMTRRQATPPS